MNVIVAGKQPALDYLSMDDAIVHCTRGLGIWEWASNDERRRAGRRARLLRRRADARDARGGGDPARAAARAEGARRQRRRPDAAAAGRREHPHGLSDAEFDALFTTDRPVVFAYHGYPWLIHRLTYRRTNHDEPPRARLQGGGHDDDAVRHGHAQRPRPLPPRDRRDRPRARARPARAAQLRQEMVDRAAARRARTRASTARTTRTSATGPGRSDAVLVVNAGSTSLKLHARRRRRVARRSTSLDAVAGRRRGRAPRRPRRRALPRAGR